MFFEVDGVGHEGGVTIVPDFMDSDESAALFGGVGGEGNGGPVATGGGRVGGEGLEEGFSGDADGEAFWGGATGWGEEAVQVGEEGEVVVGGFSEADAWVEEEGVLGDTVGGAGGGDGFEEGSDFGEKVGVVWLVLHGFWLVLHMHNDCTGLGFGDGFAHEGVFQAVDVIDEVGTGSECRAGDFGFTGVDGEGDVWEGGELFDDGDGAAEFFIEGDGLGAGACGFAADVDDVGAEGDHGLGVGDGFSGLEEGASVGEGIRGGVEDSHEERRSVWGERQRFLFDVPGCGHGFGVACGEMCCRSGRHAACNFRECVRDGADGGGLFVVSLWDSGAGIWREAGAFGGFGFCEPCGEAGLLAGGFGGGKAGVGFGVCGGWGEF